MIGYVPWTFLKVIKRFRLLYFVIFDTDIIFSNKIC